MNVLVLGGQKGEAEQRLVMAIRLRWPEAVLCCTPDDEEFLQLLEQQAPDLAVLVHADAGAAERVIRRVRGFSEIPLIVQEPLNREPALDDVLVLEAGADDVIRASASPLEMLARVVALTRRVWNLGFQDHGQPLIAGNLLLNPSTHEVLLNDERIHLTGTEFQLLHLLLKRKGSVVSHQILGKVLWGDQGDISGLAKKYVQRLRSKLQNGGLQGDPQVLNVYGVGYRLYVAAEERGSVEPEA